MTIIDSASWLSHRGSVGPAVVGEIHICDDDGNEMPQGEIGTVFFANGPRFEYHGEPEKTAKSYNEQGWSTLGDVGYVDEDNFLYLTDRRRSKTCLSPMPRSPMWRCSAFPMKSLARR
jgi:acyl-CoA synthetase (AMP-forming)/AMP-acid ligase II